MGYHVPPHLQPRPHTVEYVPKKKPTPPHGIRHVKDGLGVVCQRCGADWGECEHSCDHVSTKVDNNGTWFILGLAVGMVVTSVFFNLL